ncbi:MAG TPA: hypothetical protein VGP55_16275 [Chitinophagaceae bacterium]|nr:hypothetical protein [Chitinophagaceae bacterium]
MNKSLEICSGIIAALLGIAYPILTEVIANLNEKYSSNLIVDLFLEERILRFFKRTLIATLILIAIYFLELKRFSWFDLGRLNYLINDSASYLTLIATTFLVIFFFILIDKVLIFYRPNAYTNYLKNQHTLSNQKESGDKYFSALSDLLIYSIRIRNEKIATTISDFHYFAFKKFRDDTLESGVEYPAAYYDIIYRAIEELAVISTKRLAFIQVRTAGAIWLLGELRDSKISELTYSHLWRNSRLSLDYKRDDFLLDYWQTAHQHFNYLLRDIEKQYNNRGEVINLPLIEKRQNERNRFLEFNIFWGALLLYEKRYDCLKEIFWYSNSKPPSYELLPSKMNDIFYNLFNFTDEYSDFGSHISWKYSFPKMRGMDSDDKIFDSIFHYFAVLFLRQYSIVAHYVYMKPLALPNLPDANSDKKRWLDNLPYFKKIVTETLANRYLLKKVKLDFLVDDYYKTNSLKSPLEIIEDLITDLNASLENAEINQKISADKVNQFYLSTKAILSETLKLYNGLRNAKPIKTDSKSLYIIGTLNVIPLFLEPKITSQANVRNAAYFNKQINFMTLFARPI